MRTICLLLTSRYSSLRGKRCRETGKRFVLCASNGATSGSVVVLVELPEALPQVRC